MTILPQPIPVEHFTVAFRGSFGRFRTDSSNALHYLQSTTRTKDLGRLSTASETFDIRDIDFEELIQRDIDMGRVAEIANEYLSAGKGRPIFFPPLLICLVVLDENGKLKSAYDAVEPERVKEGQADVLRRTYDNDGFQLDLYETTSKYSDRTIEWEGAAQPVPFLDYVAKLSINPDRCKLVVLDGQHRFKALQQLLDNTDTRTIVANIEQPVCIVWMPNAKQGDHEHIVQDLRDVFVTVNSKSRLVSGHFTLLLRDNSYAAATVRALANAWKSDQAGGWSRLHLLEWNTREDKSTDNRQRNFSITTVTIIANVLQTYLFNAPGLAAVLLKLDERKADLDEAEPDFNYKAVKDLARGIAVNHIIDEQIKAHIVPALDHLLRKLRPYAQLESVLNAAFVEQKQQIDKGGNPALPTLRRYLDRFVYKPEEVFDDLAKGAMEAFREKVKVPPEERVYFLSVFQQGYIRFWLTMSRLLATYGVEALDSAKAVVHATDAFAAHPKYQYLNDEKLYVQRMLWRSGAVNYGSAWAKEAWTNVQVAALLRTDVMTAFLKSLPQGALGTEQLEAFQQEAKDLALRAALAYTSRLEVEVTEDVKKNLPFYFGETRAGVLRDLRASSPEQFDQEIGKVARNEFRQALDSLAAALQVKSSQLRPIE